MCLKQLSDSNNLTEVTQWQDKKETPIQTQAKDTRGDVKPDYWFALSYCSYASVVSQL